MNTARAISPEVAARATDLPECPPCRLKPLRVTDRKGLVYVHCPGCCAHTHRCATAHGADVQWRVLAATAEAKA